MSRRTGRSPSTLSEPMDAEFSTLEKWRIHPCFYAGISRSISRQKKEHLPPTPENTYKYQPWKTLWPMSIYAGLWVIWTHSGCCPTYWIRGPVLTDVLTSISDSLSHPDTSVMSDSELESSVSSMLISVAMLRRLRAIFFTFLIFGLTGQ